MDKGSPKQALASLAKTSLKIMEEEYFPAKFTYINSNCTIISDVLRDCEILRNCATCFLFRYVHHVFRLPGEQPSVHWWKLCMRTWLLRKQSRDLFPGSMFIKGSPLTQNKFQRPMIIQKIEQLFI